MKKAVFVFSSLAVGSGKIYFSETFGEGWESRWTLSKWKDSDTEKMGKWTATAGKLFKDKVEDTGIQTSEIMKFYAIAASFDSFSNEGKELVVQYQAKYEKDLGCGGGYLKVGPKQDDLTTFGDPTPYHIMFGPDQCNADKRTHLIFSYKGKNYLKKKELPYKQEGEGISHLYRLILKPDSTVRVEVDQEEVFVGSLGDDWEMLPAKEIADPTDKKPEDWVEDSMMDDPQAVKPADWVDEKQIIDAESTKPEEWDDEEDGEWERPKITNPAYKGEWIAQRISNPAYKGDWEVKKIPNPDFVDNPELYKYDDIGFVGFDVYQVKGGTIFDNVVIADSIAEADFFAAKWKALNEFEQAEKKQTDDAQNAAFEKFRAARAAKAAAAKEAEDSKKDTVNDDEKDKDSESEKVSQEL